MDECIQFQAFMRHLIDDEKLVKPGAQIIQGLLEAQSPRITNISERMSGESARNHKTIQRFLKKAELKRLLGERPLVLDRKFNYEELMEVLYIEIIQFVIRLNPGD